ncbi:MAG: hypothetical protein ACE5IK_07175 [Acidobacteriota bacterium]
MSASDRHPLARRILAGEAPESLCLAAARGALPVPPEDLLQARVWVAEHGTAAAAAACRQAVVDQPAPEMVRLVADVTCDPAVLAFVAQARLADDALMVAVVENPAATDDTLTGIAAAGPARAVERLVDNQQRLLAAPALIETLNRHPDLPPAARIRLRDLSAEIDRRQRRRSTPAVDGGEDVTRTGTGDEVAEAAEVEVATEAVPVLDDVPGAEADEAVAEEEPEVEDLELFQRIMNMTLPEKIQLAMKGNREERALLVRDSNRSVAMAVMKSPKITESEVEKIAGMRNVVEDVVIALAGSREWTKSYAVIHALCKNPKTPIRKAMTFMSRLNNRDLRLLGSDRNIPEIVRLTARRFFVARTQTSTRRPGKKK